MIPEREREALMRLTMCARDECDICKYRYMHYYECMELATKNMNILADALRKDESNSENPNNCEEQTERHTCETCKHTGDYDWCNGCYNFDLWEEP